MDMIVLNFHYKPRGLSKISLWLGRFSWLDPICSEDTLHRIWNASVLLPILSSQSGNTLLTDWTQSKYSPDQGCKNTWCWQKQIKTYFLSFSWAACSWSCAFICNPLVGLVELSVRIFSWKYHWTDLSLKYVFYISFLQHYFLAQNHSVIVFLIYMDTVLFLS